MLSLSVTLVWCINNTMVQDRNIVRLADIAISRIKMGAIWNFSHLYTFQRKKTDYLTEFTMPNYRFGW